MVIGSDNFQQVKNQAIRLRNHPKLHPSKLNEVSDPDFLGWAKYDSFALAREVAYEKGALKSGSTLTQTYRDKAKEIGERRIALAGYRLANKLVEIFDYKGVELTNSAKPPTTPPSNQNEAPIYGNKNSKIYHLSNCPNYKDISLQNRVPFSTEEEAQKAGFRKAKNCP
jgi:hypothetical protein